MKVEQWEKALAVEVDRWRDTAFCWGSSDCLHFCMAAGEAVTGRDLLGALPAYTTEAGAARQLKKLGFASVADLVSARLEEKPVASAARGDWVMIGQDGLVPGAFGVVLGAQSAHMSENGLAFLPVLSAVRAWGLS